MNCLDEISSKAKDRMGYEWIAMDKKKYLEHYQSLPQPARHTPGEALARWTREVMDPNLACPEEYTKDNEVVTVEMVYVKMKKFKANEVVNSKGEKRQLAKTNKNVSNMQIAVANENIQQASLSNLQLVKSFAAKPISVMELVKDGDAPLENGPQKKKKPSQKNKG
eukprot:7497438-Karenia_brevis.AAC.1